MEILLEDVRKVYAELARRGYLVIRGYANMNKADMCYIEADLHHNEIELMEDKSMIRHMFYLSSERKLYLQKSIEMCDIYSAYVTYKNYFPLWNKLEKLFCFNDDEINTLCIDIKKMADEYIKISALKQ